MPGRVQDAVAVCPGYQQIPVIRVRVLCRECRAPYHCRGAETECATSELQVTSRGGDVHAKQAVAALWYRSTVKLGHTLEMKISPGY